MRADPSGSSLTQRHRDPRVVVGIIFPTASIYLTNRTGIANVPGVPIHGALKDLSATSQEINPEQARATIGTLSFSAVDLLDHMAVLKGIAGKGERKDTVETLLAQVNLWEVRKKWVSGYSGGMRQRFGIAQALIGRPALIIVDEPTAGLDPEERNRFLNLLAEIGENVVVILSTHIVDDVADLCPRMAVLAGGKILKEGAPSDLVAQLSGKVWRKTIDRGELEAERARHQIISTRLAGGRTVIHARADAAPDAEFQVTPPGLEDVYFSTLSASRRAA